MFKYLIWFVVAGIWAQPNDPFVAPIKKRHGPIKDEKIQYLGYIKINEKIYGFIRRLGGEIERIPKGKNSGLGQVNLISSHRICIKKNKQCYCLRKTNQVGRWKKVDN